MKTILAKTSITLLILFSASCSSDDSSSSITTPNSSNNTTAESNNNDSEENNSNENEQTSGESETTNDSVGQTPSAAFDEFSDNVTVTFNNDNTISIETDGTPNHKSPYWDSAHSLYIDPVIATENRMSPGTISEGSYSLTVPNFPEIAATSTSTGLGAIGIATSGVPIFNDEEGPNVALSATVASGFDFAGGHMGPSGYHYHLESHDVSVNTTLSHDDEDLVGIMEDGFLLYGRRCNSINDGDNYGYPTDLDSSGGHTHKTQHCSEDDDSIYHYHIVNEIYTGNYYVLFGGDLQGTPQGI